MGKSTQGKPQEFEQVERNEPTELPNVEVSADLEVKSPQAVDVYKDRIDRFVGILGGTINVETEKYGQEQLAFMLMLDKVIAEEYSVFASAMDHLVNLVRVETKAFRMERIFAFTQHDDVKAAKKQNGIAKYESLMSAVMTLGRNLRDRKRVGRQVDVTLLTKGYHPKAAQNLQNYFSRMYS